MDLTYKLKVGQVVKSRAGRDNGRVFLVTKILDDQYVYIVDGNLRKLDNPKKKKIKHLTVFNSVLIEYQERLKNDIMVNDAYIRRILEPFKKDSKFVEQEVRLPNG